MEFPSLKSRKWQTLNLSVCVDSSTKTKKTKKIMELVKPTFYFLKLYFQIFSVEKTLISYMA